MRKFALRVSMFSWLPLLLVAVVAFVVFFSSFLHFVAFFASFLNFVAHFYSCRFFTLDRLNSAFRVRKTKKRAQANTDFFRLLIISSVLTNYFRYFTKRLNSLGLVLLLPFCAHICSGPSNEDVSFTK